MAAILSQIIIGISSGMTTFLMAAGLSLIMSGMGVINFGQGAFYVLGAYVCFSVSQSFGFWLGLLAALFVTAAIGGLTELALRPLYGKEMMYQVLLTMGISYILVDMMSAIWGYTNKITSTPEMLKGTIRFAGTSLPKYYIFIIGVSLLIAIAFALMFRKTKLGMLFRAIIVDRQMVNSLGVNVTLLFSIMFMLGVALSGVAGALMAPTTGLTSNLANTALTNVMTVLIIGGLTSMSGCFYASLIVGVVNSLGAMFIPQFYSVIPAALMVIVLLIKPEGLFASKS